jgi:hypothetical protein
MLTVEDGAVAAMFSDGGESGGADQRRNSWCTESSMSDGATQNREKKGRR